jgi:hypothetical protein
MQAMMSLFSYLELYFLLQFKQSFHLCCYGNSIALVLIVVGYPSTCTITFFKHYCLCDRFSHVPYPCQNVTLIHQPIILHFPSRIFWLNNCKGHFTHDYNYLFYCFCLWCLDKKTITNWYLLKSENTLTRKFNA